MRNAGYLAGNKAVVNKGVEANTMFGGFPAIPIKRLA